MDLVTSHFLEHLMVYIRAHRKIFDKIFILSGKLIFSLCDKVLNLLVHCKQPARI